MFVGRKGNKMRKQLKKLGIVALVTLLSVGAGISNVQQVAYAHSGRTDSAGGHRDNKNKSGLGSYHYHCGGHPAHLHNGGGCPYSGGGSTGRKTEHHTQRVQPKPKEKICVSNVPKEFCVGDNHGFTYTVENGTGASVTVTSNNTDVVAVNSDNTLKAVGVGQAEITVTTGTATETFTVEVKPVLVEDIAVESESIRLEMETEYTITAKVLPENATDQTIRWFSDNANVVEVNDGRLIPQKEGTAAILIEAANGVKKEIKVEVYVNEVQSIEIDDSAIEYLRDNTVDLKSVIKLDAIVKPTDATYPEVEWCSSDDNVIKVVDGEFEIVGEGNVTLTVKAKNGVAEEIELNVVDSSKRTYQTLGGLAIVAALGGGFYWKKKKHQNA